MGNAKEKRDNVRAKARGKRADIRVSSKSARDSVRKCVGKCSVIVLALTLAMAFGCNTATPASKSASSKACDNVTTVNNYIGLLPVSVTNAPAFQSGALAFGPGGLTISVSDLNGTIAQSADTAGGDSTALTASPSMAAGITGDKPVEAMQKAVSAFASPQDAISATLSAMAKKFGFGAATNAVVEAAGGCANGECSEQ